MTKAAMNIYLKESLCVAVCFHFSCTDLQEWNYWIIWEICAQLLRNYQTVFESNRTTLAPHQQCMMIPVSSSHCQHLLFHLTAVLVGRMCGLNGISLVINNPKHLLLSLFPISASLFETSSINKTLPFLDSSRKNAVMLLWKCIKLTDSNSGCCCRHCFKQTSTSKT